MNASSEKVLKYLTGYESIEAVTAEYLQKQVAESPYFPITQFLLAKKLKSKNEEEYLLQAQKTALYFSNPYWLSYQLSENEFDEDIPDPDFTTISVEEKQEEVSGESADNLIPSTLESTNPNQSSAETDEIEENVLFEDKDIEKEKSERAVENTEIDTERTESPEIIQENQEGSDVIDTVIEEQEGFKHDIGANASNSSDQINLSNLPPAVEKEVIELEEEMAGVTHSSEDTTKEFLAEAEIKKEDLLQDDEHDRMFKNIKAMLDASSEEASADTQNAVIPMDPYYTIDYFASQGIKLELDQNPQDQLGQHLKKFTQWLKHMKKLGPEDATEVISRTETDADIQQIADSSNTVREVVTEAMALVLEKQGKKDKAIELYNKLSFLNPDKRTYFADKIKKLKGF